MMEKKGVSEKENIKELFREYRRNPHTLLRNEIVQKYLYMVDILAKKYINRGIEYDDLYQVGALALIQAVERYDIEKGFEFSSFATPTILGEIKKYFRDKGFIIKIPRNVQTVSKKVSEAREELYAIYNRVPYVKEIAQHIGHTQEEVLEAMESSKVYSMQSMESPLEYGDGEESYLAEIIGEEDASFQVFEDKDFIEKTANTFSKEQYEIFRLRYYENKTQQEIATIFGVSQMTISRIEKKIIDKFKKGEGK